MNEFTVQIKDDLKKNELYMKRLENYNFILNYNFEKIKLLNIIPNKNLTIKGNLTKTTVYYGNSDISVERNKIYKKQRIEMDRLLKFIELLS